MTISEISETRSYKIFSCTLCSTSKQKTPGEHFQFVGLRTTPLNFFHVGKKKMLFFFVRYSLLPQFFPEIFIFPSPRKKKFNPIFCLFVFEPIPTYFIPWSFVIQLIKECSRQQGTGPGEHIVSVLANCNAMLPFYFF